MILNVYLKLSQIYCKVYSCDDWSGQISRPILLALGDTYMYPRKSVVESGSHLL